MIWYPLSTLMLFGIKDIWILSNAEDIPNIQQLLGDGSQMELNLAYKAQDAPNGIAKALILEKSLFEMIIFV